MHLTLFFTHNTSLRTWDRVGMLNREISLYKKFMEMGARITFITYGHRDKKIYSKKLEGIEICCNELKLPLRLYSGMIPILHRKALKATNIIKSNQTTGAIQALRAANIFKKPFLARSGYMYSDFIAQQQGIHSYPAKKALKKEAVIFKEASWIVVTTPMMSQNIISRIPSTTNKILVIPNFVDTNIFQPKSINKTIDILFIGRLTHQKNIDSLLYALQGLNLRTAIIGSGSLEKELKDKSSELNLDIEWHGNIPNSHLPDFINRSKIFILPSHYEGHPKTMIEAMACGSAIIGSDAPGIREVIEHNKTGFLTKNNPENLLHAIKHLLNNTELREQLGSSARTYAINNYSLDIIAENEYQLLKNISNMD